MPTGDDNTGLIGFSDLLLAIFESLSQKSWPWYWSSLLKIHGQALLRCLVLAEEDAALAQPLGARDPGLLFWL